jgi:hypothetical protein
MKQLLKLAAIAVSLFVLQSATAQSTTDSSEKLNPQFKLSVNYNSNLNFFGRTDSLKSSGLFPLAEFWLSSKFYINAAPVFVNNAVQQFDYAGTVATIGYQNVTPDWITGLYLTKPFYKESSELVQSALQLQSGVNLTYRNNIVNINAGGNVMFSDKADFSTSGGLDHIIRIQNNNSVIVIDPSVYVYAGTQNFQRTYYRKNNTGLLPLTGRDQRVTEDVSRFSILAYEASVPVIYAKGKVMFIATPSYIMPQNLVTVPGRPDLSERGENTFYTTLTAKYSF